jgi:hypothetical protein
MASAEAVEVMCLELSEKGGASRLLESTLSFRVLLAREAEQNRSKIQSL